MRIADIELLEYLHDATVQEICFATGANGFKILMIRGKCDEDCGYLDWAGKRIVVTLSDVILASGMLFGHVAGEDMIQSFSQGVSAKTRQWVADLSSAGISTPTALLRFVLQSGSDIEVACGEINVTVAE